MSRVFDGTNDFIGWGNVTTLNEQTAISFGGWSWVDSVLADHSIINKQSSNNVGWSFINDDVGSSSGRTDTFKVYVQEAGANGTNSAFIEGATAASQANRWQWVSFTFAANVAGGLHFYVNNLEDANSPVTTANIAECGGAAAPVLMGENTSGTTDRLGRLAWMHCWNRMVGPGALEQSRWFPGSVPHSLQLFTPMLSGAAAEVDYSPTGATGTLTGTTSGQDNPPVNGWAVVPCPGGAY